MIRGILVGLLTALAALGAAELAAALIDDHASPVVAVGGAAIDATPEWLKAFAIRTFGSNDKLALLVGMAAVIAGLAIAMGIASVRRPWIGFAGLALFAAVGVAAASTRPTAGSLAAVPSIVGAAAGIAALAALLREDPDRRSARARSDRAKSALPVEMPGGLDRRRFFLASAAIGAAAVGAGAIGRVLIAERFGAVDAARDALKIPAPADPAPLRPSGVSIDVEGLTPFVTPNADFYRVDTALLVPRVDPDTWRLSVRGMVDRTLELSLDDLLARSMIERDLTLTCVSNEVGGTYAGNARWVGVPLKGLLEEVGPHDGADQLVSRSVDGFTVGTPTASVLDGRDAILAVSMNGEPLPFAHGFPVRMIVPGLYGYTSATKWVTDLELTTFDAFDPYWVQRGWSREAPVKTMSRIDIPRPLAQLKPGTVMVAGIAWAQHRGIERVEIRVDGGSWQPATLAASDSVDTWRQWRLPWNASRGRHTIEVRATDNDGVTQSEARMTPFPNGATGWHSVVVTVT